MTVRSDDHENAEALATLARRAKWRGRLAALGAGLLVALLLGGGVLVNASWSAAHADVCETWEPVDISIDDLIALKRRKNAWQASMQEDAALVMTDREVNFILRGTTDYELLATFVDDHVEARLAAPYEGGCWNVRFTGVARVNRRVAIFIPERLVVGELDLTPVVGGAEWSFGVDDVQGWVDRRVLDALDNAENIAIEDGRVHIRLYDRRKVW